MTVKNVSSRWVIISSVPIDHFPLLTVSKLPVCVRVSSEFYYTFSNIYRCDERYVNAGILCFLLCSSIWTYRWKHTSRFDSLTSVAYRGNVNAPHWTPGVHGGTPAVTNPGEVGLPRTLWTLGWTPKKHQRLRCNLFRCNDKNGKTPWLTTIISKRGCLTRYTNKQILVERLNSSKCCNVVWLWIVLQCLRWTWDRLMDLSRKNYEDSEEASQLQTFELILFVEIIVTWMLEWVSDIF